VSTRLVEIALSAGVVEVWAELPKLPKALKTGVLAVVETAAKQT